MEAVGLKGFGKAASRVSMLMNEKMIEEMEKQIKSQQVGPEDELTKEQEMEKQIERLIAIKKPPVKKFNNNPPKKEVPGPIVIQPDTWGKKKTTTKEDSESSSDDSDT